MNQKKDNEDGITRIALTIIIIVIFLAISVGVGIIINIGDILSYSKDSIDNVANNKTIIENKLDINATDSRDKLSTTKWIDNGNNSYTNGTIVVKIGDYINYNSTIGVSKQEGTYISTKNKNGYENQEFRVSDYTGRWRILGIDNEGHLEIISEKSVPLTNQTDCYYIDGKEGYAYGIEELNNICAIYGKGEYAISARCVTVEDIDKITGYNANNIGVKDVAKVGKGIKYMEHEDMEYGMEVTYSLRADGVMYQAKNGKSGINEQINIFTYYDEHDKTWKKLNLNEKIVLKNNEYMYNPITLSDDIKDKKAIGIIADSTEHQMLFGGTLGGHQYWLANKFTANYMGNAVYGLGWIMLGEVSNATIYRSDEFKGEEDVQEVLGTGVRPVVTIESNTLLKDTKTTQDKYSVWNIK